MSNITQVVNTDKNMTILKKSVIASGLDNVLSGTGPFTVFAPTDLAFEKLKRYTTKVSRSYFLLPKQIATYALKKNCLWGIRRSIGIFLEYNSPVMPTSIAETTSL